jgi:hypothetical protein
VNEPFYNLYRISKITIRETDCSLDNLIETVEGLTLIAECCLDLESAFPEYLERYLKEKDDD